jgi:hypothetical protein
MRRLAALILAPLCSWAGLLSGLARAQSADDRVTADTLFDDARKLMASGSYAEACGKLETSMKLVPRLGTELNLAECHEHIGKLAAAWAEWRASAAQAAKDKDDRAGFAKERADALAGKLPRILVKVADGEPAGLVVTRDGVALDATIFGSAIPVDPGDHVLDATAPGVKDRFRRMVTTVAGETVEVDVPVLGAAAAPAPETPTPADGGSEAHPGRRLAGIVAMGGGGALVVTSLILGAVAKSTYNGAVSKYCDGGHCFAAAEQPISSAKSTATAATILMVVGGAAVATGAVLFLISPRHEQQTAAWIAPTGGGVAVAGRF